ncbi:hypothetical protein L6452_13130 [Arctium lappa]|uniref:Uncharacterized protein n=1 Tax=Arctium lappa TaxID=4217 RepID=A0ACB9CHG1_ARCLA|nr:hypothetical protein L6452_13130 [Arctium lappa]
MEVTQFNFRDRELEKSMEIQNNSDIRCSHSFSVSHRLYTAFRVLGCRGYEKFEVCEEYLGEVVEVIGGEELTGEAEGRGGDERESEREEEEG